MNAVSDFDVILTIDARTNVLLQVVTEQFGLTDGQVFRELRGNVRHLRTLLAKKGIEYVDLKRALVPNTDRIERAFLFDWDAMNTGSYGVRVFDFLLPLLPKTSTRSVLAGDWASNWRPSAVLRESRIELHRPAGISGGGDVPDTLYVVYLNNLTPPMAAAIETAFTNLRGYVGSLDMTFSSIFKAMLSTTLIRDFVQHKGIVLLGHEDDRDETEDHSLKPYDFANAGFRVRSVPSWLYGVYLSYKIERPVFDFDHWDAKFSINAMTPVPTPLLDCEVVLEESKLGYLMAQKAGSLKRAGLAGLRAADVAEQIRRKLAASYIYNLARSDDVDTLKFNIVLEAGGARSMCALEYRPSARQLRVITLF